MVTNSMRNMMASALWADDGIRARLLAGDPPDISPGSAPPTSAPDGRLIHPPLEASPGVLRVPDAKDQPAHDVFFNWLEHGGGRELSGLARNALSQSGIIDQFNGTVVNALFGRA